MRQTQACSENVLGKLLFPPTKELIPNRTNKNKT